MGPTLKKTYLIEKAAKIFSIIAELETMAKVCSENEKSLSNVYCDCSANLYDEALTLLRSAAKVED